MKPIFRRRCLQISTLAIAMAMLMSVPGGPVAAEGTTETLDTFMGGYKSRVL
ncbi:MAG: hypothetical protein GWN18_18410, partial [Thermoplasmata archaeon]|nr:hypothetical protein [Thermoplasmata archaeon]NIS21946.1 hypothetical protein [Thermoplasmata archaeon]NIT79805.1 hypothetical protein [Thermoplasmata archaeon]NIU50971.1 hypothetical protein [Thermoplasmata archaeon]NIW84488.1 hypothetical protein [Thermoplasmata archaeon]